MATATSDKKKGGKKHRIPIKLKTAVATEQTSSSSSSMWKQDGTAVPSLPAEQKSLPTPESEDTTASTKPKLPIESTKKQATDGFSDKPVYVSPDNWEDIESASDGMREISVPKPPKCVTSPLDKSIEWVGSAMAGLVLDVALEWARDALTLWTFVVPGIVLAVLVILLVVRKCKDEYYPDKKNAEAQQHYDDDVKTIENNIGWIRILKNAVRKIRKAFNSTPKQGIDNDVKAKTSTDETPVESVEMVPHDVVKDRSRTQPAQPVDEPLEVTDADKIADGESAPDTVNPAEDGTEE